MKPLTSVKVSEVPICNICKLRNALRTTVLGLGKGQKLIAQKAKVTND